MAKKWNKYGPVWISAGMFLTGVLWWQRPNSATIRGEDAAEIRAAAEERLMAWYSGDTYAPTKYDTLGTNWLISTQYLSSVGIRALTTPYRTRLLTAMPLYYGTTNWAATQAVWFATATTGNFGTAYSQWMLDADGADQGIVHVINQFAGYPNWVYGTQCVYSAITVEASYMQLPEGESNFFSIVFNQAPTNGAMTVITNGFEVYTNVATAGKIGEVIRTEDFSTAMDELREHVIVPEWHSSYSVVQVLDPGYEPEDGDSLVTGNAYAEPYSVYTNENEAAGVNQIVTLYRGAGATNIVQLARTADSRNIAAGEGVRVWQYAQSPTNAEYAPLSGLFYSGATSTLAAASLGFEYGGGNWWTHIGMGTSLYYFAWQRPGSNTVYDYEQTGYKYVIRRADLDNARNFLTNIVRTANLNAGGSWSNAFLFTYKAETNGDLTGEDAGLVAPFVGPVTTVWTNALVDGGPSVIVNEESQWYATSNGSYTNGQTGVIYERGFGSIVQQEVVHGFYRLDYPCRYALTNGYVGRIRIFAVYDNACYIRKVDPYFGNVEPYNEVEGYMQTWQAQAWEQKAYGIAANFQDVPTGYPSVATETEQSAGDLGYMQGSRLTLLADVMDPTEAPVVEIGRATPDLSAFDEAQGVEEAIVYHATNNPTLHYDERRSYLWIGARTLEIDRFVVVVDWKWKHMNAANPYVPTPFTPEWAVTNTP